MAHISREKLSPSDIYRRALVYKGEYTKEDFPELTKVVYWIRQLLGVYELHLNYIV